MLLEKDVVIVGAGMVGLSLALSLHNSGLKVAIVEARSIHESLDTSRIETRVSAINHTSKRFLESLDVWKGIKNNRTSNYYQMKVWDDSLNDMISISSEDISEPNLGCIVENDVITHELIKKIRSTSIAVYTDRQITEIIRENNKAKVTLDEMIIETSLIVGADGANSFIRNYFDFETIIEPYNHAAIVATIELEKPHQETAYQRFYDKGILALLPLSEKNRCSIVWSVKTEYAKYLMSLNELEFEEELSKSSNDICGNLKLLSKRFSFELIQRHAKKYIQQNVVLVGDACHTIHPLAGQGVNLGFKDVVALSKVISDSYNKNRMICDISTLDKYQRQRKIDNTSMILAMKTFKEGFANDNDYIVSIRRLGLDFINKNNILKKIIVKQAL